MRLLDKKVRKVMGMRTDTPDMAEALDALAGFYGRRAGGNTLEARRALRSDLEWQAVSVSNTFLKQFEEIESVRGRGYGWGVGRPLPRCRR